MPADAASAPLVSCLMPTRGRRDVVGQAIHCFLRQDYPNRELIIVDDGPKPARELIPADSRIRYIRLEDVLSQGEKRHLAYELAQGDILAHWDELDWQAPHRLRHQVRTLLRRGAPLCGIHRQLIYQPEAGRAWVHTRTRSRRPAPTFGSLCYARDVWSSVHLEGRDEADDKHLLETFSEADLVLMPNSNLQVTILQHGDPRSQAPKGSDWRPYPLEQIRALMGTDCERYHAVAVLETTHTMAQSPSRRSLNTRSFDTTPVFAERDDLGLIEVGAFNRGRTLEMAKRWTYPFALFQARLFDAANVLNCSLQTQDFQAPLTLLYPNVHYRDFCPTRGGELILPAGYPEEAFDRILVIDTLEHLTAPDREKLLADLCLKLKPGGLIVVTGLQHLEDERRAPLPERTGRDRSERRRNEDGSTGGPWTAQACMRLAFKVELRPLFPEPPCTGEAEEADPATPPGGPPAAFGAVFYKPPRPVLEGKGVVLALLTWNKRDVSVDSVMAYLREARMLRRLGYRPFLCVCDNGSTDGTPEALRGLEPVIDVPYRFIFNGENRGNCIGRNQIIDYLLECGADYLLFMDGDIEIVPFSSAAMLRHMESCGHRLGCLGADSASQTNIRGLSSRYHFSVGGCRLETDNMVAWTQYGMFRREMFVRGLRFDESGPFAGPGWGFEDNDLAFQMDQAGFLNQRFFGMTYLHRDIRSSVRIMRERGVDALKLCEQRRQFVIRKWKDVPAIDQGPLQVIRRMHFTEL